MLTDTKLRNLKPQDKLYLIPSIDFEAQRRFRRGSQAAELIDYFAANFQG